MLTSVSGFVGQISNQAAVLVELIATIRSGSVFPAPSKVVLVGHSFGSGVSNGVLATNPTGVDGAILTGVYYGALNAAPSLQGKQNRRASLVDPDRWGSLDGGWMVWVDLWSNIEGCEDLILSGNLSCG